MIAKPIEAGVPFAAETHAPDSIEALARAHAGHLLSVATGILGDPGEAEDAVQDALLLAWKSWNQVREPERRAAWLTQICVRRCLRVRLAVRRRREHVPETAMVHLAAAEADRWADWDAAFARLSPRQRAVVILHYRDQYTLDECASLMGCRPGSARRHLSRALVRLRKEIQDEQ